MQWNKPAIDEKLVKSEHKPEKSEKEKEKYEKEGKETKETKYEKEHKDKYEYEGGGKGGLLDKTHVDKYQSESALPSVEAGGPEPLSTEMLLAYAASLEEAGQTLRHFIEQSQRPDLSKGALQEEPDQ